MAARPVIRVLIADQSPISCQSLKASLEDSCKRARIVGSAANQVELMEVLGTGAIDVALISDVFLRGAAIGVQPLRSIHQQFQQTKFVALLKHLDAAAVVFAFRSGVRGVFDRSENAGSLCKCIEAVEEGRIWANSKDLQHLAEELMDFDHGKSR